VLEKNTYVTCPDCRGATFIRHVEKCSECSGKGCEECNYTGEEVTEDPCRTCGEKGGWWENVPSK